MRVTLSRDDLPERDQIRPADLQLRVSRPSGVPTESFPVNLLDRFGDSRSIDLIYEIPHDLTPNSGEPLNSASRSQRTDRSLLVMAVPPRP